MKKRYIFIPLAAVLISTLMLFTSVDGKIFDLFLRTLPSLEEDPKVLLINIDDLAIEKVGFFPWTRDILADGIILLREMGADTVVFDLSYLDESPDQVNYSYMEHDLPKRIDYNFGQINDNISQILNAFGSGMLGPADATDFRDQLIDENNEIQRSMEYSIANITQDVDSYFASALQFFGKSYLTLTMVTPEDLAEEDLDDQMDQEELMWLQENIALQNYTMKEDQKIPESLGILPAIPQLLTNSHGAGFVNAPVDNDGFRRRLHLLYKFNDYYYPQFAFAPMLNRLGNPEVEVSNRRILLKGADIDGQVQDISIPRSRDGSVLINWPQKVYEDYNQISAWSLIKCNRLEEDFIRDLEKMEQFGFFSYWDQDITPLEIYSQCLYIKDSLMLGEEDFSIEDYRDYRNAFFSSIGQYLTGNYENIILADITGSENEELRVNIRNTFRIARTSYDDLMILREQAAAKALDAFCIIGAEATSMTDMGLTTFQERFPNVGIHAALANMILSGEFIDDSPILIGIIMSLVLSCLLSFLISKMETGPYMIAGIAILIFSVLIQLVIFVIFKRYIGVIVPLLAVAITFLSLSIINFFTALQEKTFLRSAFSRYLSPTVINELIEDPSKLNLGGEKREMTAIFTDIRGFSGMAEKLNPTDLVKLLNMYLTEMSNIIMENGGTIDKYEGDAIIAFFGAPIYHEDHATLACRTVIAMKKAEAALNEKIIKQGIIDEPIFTRMGINTGDMVVGNMGSDSKMDYTIMGHAVNLAARLEGVNKQYNTKGLLVSEYTKTQLNDDFILRRLDRVRVVGVSEPLRLYELLCLKSELDISEMDELENWERAIDCYEKRDFTGALSIFEELSSLDPEDNVAKLYITRCKEFKDQAPSGEWDGVFNLTKK